MAYELKAETVFSAAHALRGYQGDCERTHGHNFRVQAVVCGQELDELGMLVDFKILKEQLVKACAELDHQDLNRLPAFEKKNPSSEVLAEYIYGQLSELLQKKYSGRVKLRQITVWESEKYGATYRP
jgi:6-pyruvoyltetrahydropterin/6-carboxytetrahydropterin synthase